MIKFGGNSKTGRIIGFGLSEENVRRLKEGMPILIDSGETKKLLGVDARIMIFYGRTEEEIIKEMGGFGIKVPEGWVEGE